MTCPNPSKLVGSWRLEEFRVVEPEGTSTSHPFGTDASGILIYASDGWMSVQIAAQLAPELLRGSCRHGRLHAAAFESYLSYGGPYDVMGDEVAHHVFISSSPELVGSTQRRWWVITDDALVLRGAPADRFGTHAASEIRWARLNRLRAAAQPTALQANVTGS